jgi:hypothetical protein
MALGLLTLLLLLTHVGRQQGTWATCGAGIWGNADPCGQQKNGREGDMVTDKSCEWGVNICMWVGIWVDAGALSSSNQHMQDGQQLAYYNHLRMLNLASEAQFRDGLDSVGLDNKNYMRCTSLATCMHFSSFLVLESTL